MTLPSSLRSRQKPSQQFQEGNEQITLSEQTQNKLPSSLRKKEKVNFPESAFMSEEEEEKEFERGKAQALSRGVESFLGTPGDIASFLTGLFGKEQKILTTSKNLREFSEKATLGYTKPKTEFEESVGDIASDIGSMAFPGGGHYSMARNIGIPIVANLTKEGLKYANADEKAQAYGKVGIMVFLDLISRRTGGVKSYVNSLFQKAEESIPKGLSLNALGLDKSLVNLENELSKGGNRSTTKKALEKVSEIKKEIKNGKIDAKRLAAYRPAINEAIEEIGGFNLEVPRKFKPAATRNLNLVKNEVIKTLSEYGEKFNPEFLRYHHSANEAAAALHNSNKIANFIQKSIPYVPKSAPVHLLFGLPSIAGTALVSPATALGIGMATLGYQGFKVLNQVRNSPTLRKYYLNVLKEASSGNVTQTTKNLKALDANFKNQ